MMGLKVMYLLEESVKRRFMGEDTYRPSVDEVESNVRKLMDDILSN